ncbi:MAG: ABC transporter ATP-binding protein [Proteobacteria bacterium]|nr:ABC transporter ATP-binding protein [Pseudomonadota bacterium]MBU1451682.1 ABC transporter ATP-binding protein [Pseudomonadota bacterium]MBU2468830.1 ABC transporter ATP-binding protein [Pseudomonadota bacterium]MBU2518791.1 ABC transporter ATP-binding protein [Pseudomonadota bacterium]
MNMLEVKGLWKKFGDLEIICGIDLAVKKGQRHAIIGPNGAGKTTFFNLLSGHYKPSAGDIYFKGQKISGLQPYRINRLGLGRSFQITNVFPGLTVLENVRSVVLSRHGVRFNCWRTVAGMEEINRESMGILEQIGLDTKADHLAGEMAYGEQRALEIGLVLASQPEMILLDEPTAGMSIDETREAVKLVDRVTEGKTLMIIEHDMEVVFSLADVITVISYGEVLASGTPEEIRNHPKVQEAYLGTGIAC